LCQARKALGRSQAMLTAGTASRILPRVNSVIQATPGPGREAGFRGRIRTGDHHSPDAGGQRQGRPPAWQATGNTMIGQGYYGGVSDLTNAQIDDVALFRLR
jgi:hypothetical protein